MRINKKNREKWTKRWSPHLGIWSLSTWASWVSSLTLHGPSRSVASGWLECLQSSSGLQRAMSRERVRQKFHDLLWPSLRSHSASFPLDCIARGSYRFPFRLEKTPPLRGGMWPSHSRKGMQEGRHAHGVVLGKYNFSQLNLSIYC